MDTWKPAGGPSRAQRREAPRGPLSQAVRLIPPPPHIPTPPCWRQLREAPVRKQRYSRPACTQGTGDPGPGSSQARTQASRAGQRALGTLAGLHSAPWGWHPSVLARPAGLAFSRGPELFFLTLPNSWGAASGPGPQSRESPFQPTTWPV